MAKLSAKQKKFVHEYLKDLNATQAATRAGYSKRTANEQGARLLANVSVQTYLQEKQQKIQEKNELTVDWVLDSLKEIHARCMHAACKQRPCAIIKEMKPVNLNSNRDRQ